MQQAIRNHLESFHSTLDFSFNEMQVNMNNLMASYERGRDSLLMSCATSMVAGNHETVDHYLQQPHQLKHESSLESAADMDAALGTDVSTRSDDLAGHRGMSTRVISQGDRITQSINTSDGCGRMTNQSEGRRNLKWKFSAFMMAKGWRDSADHRAHRTKAHTSLGLDGGDGSPDASKPKRGHRDLLKAPEWLKRLVEGSAFSGVVGVMILLNTGLIILEAESTGIESAISLNYRSDDPDREVRQDIVTWGDHFFNALFTMELILRIYAFGRKFFYSPSDLADMLFVMSGLMDSYVIPQFETRVNADLSFVRLLRLLRVVRVLRVARVMKAFAALRILLVTVASSMGALCWSVIFLFLVMLVNALFLTSILKDVIQDVTNEEDLRLWIYRYYGSAFRSCYTVFEVTMSGGWPTYARRLVEEVSVAFALYWVIYVMSVVFALLRIITAIFLRETLNQAQKDEENTFSEDMKRHGDCMVVLRQKFDEIRDPDTDLLTLAQVVRVLEDPAMGDMLRKVEIDVMQAEGLFHLLDDGDGLVPQEEFISGMMRLESVGKQLEFVSLLYENSKLACKLGYLTRLVEKVCEAHPAMLAMGHTNDTMELAGGSTAMDMFVGSMHNIPNGSGAAGLLHHKKRH